MRELWTPADALKHEADHQFDDAQHERKPHGVILVDGKEVAHTLMCPHCGAHFPSLKGTLRVRCRNCWAFVCDKPACNTHCTPIAAETGWSQNGVL